MKRKCKGAANIKKQAYICIAFVCLSFPALAQNVPIEAPTNANAREEAAATDDTAAHWRGIAVSPSFSYDLPMIMNGGAGSFKGNTSMHAGADVCYMFAPHLGVALGVQYQMYSFNYSYNGVNPTGDYNYSATANRTTANDTTVIAGYTTSVNYAFTYLHIPLLVRYLSSVNNKANFYAEAGLSFSLLMNSSVTGSATQTQYQLQQQPDTWWYNYASSTTNTQNISETNPDAGSFNVNLHAGAGIIFPCSSKLYIVLDYAVEYAIMNSGTGKNDVVKFGNDQYNFYGTGNYGTFSMQSLELKVLFRL